VAEIASSTEPVAITSDPQIASFLADYNLQDYAPRLTAALARGRAATDALSAEIFAATGLQAVRLPVVPVAVDHYPALELSAKSAADSGYLLFWRPDTPHSQGLELTSAQQDLQALGLYPGPIDGVVGPQTVLAVRAFQASVGMPQTGHIDAATFFLLRQIGGRPGNNS
jgi:hypothetical protein